nr:hypothetical protein [Streptomyces purpureus]
MGSMRNPVGPLPSSIYWRRRAVALCLIALMAVLIAWAVASLGGNGSGTPSDGANGASPKPPAITPGPSSSGPAISEQPGGRDESGASGESDGDPSDSGTGTGGDGGKNGDTVGSGTAAGPGAGAGQQVPANSPLPNCPPSSLQLTLRTMKVSYAPGERPQFQLIVRNTSATTCKADFGPRQAVLTISDSEDDDVWSSKDCPRTAGSLLLRVPAGGTITHTVEWDRARSAPQCATPPTRAVEPGTYLVEAQVPGVKVMPASFTLAKD